MSRRTWMITAAAFFVAAISGTWVCRSAGAADPKAPLVVRASDADCDDDCECDECKTRRRCCKPCCICRKLQLHCIYFHAKCSRPYRMLPYTPGPLAPYIGPGTYSYGYGGQPAYGAACPPGYGQ